MQGLITLDFGNSHPHAGLFQKQSGQWSLLKVVPLLELQIYLNQLGMNADNTSVVLCEVKSRQEEITKLQEHGFLVTRVKDYWKGSRFAGMPVHYKETLGEDRLIEAYFSYKKEKTPTLIIDAGTFVTMDVVTEEGFMGGYIIPGIHSYFETYQNGERLKDVKLNFGTQAGLPHETKEAMVGSYAAFAALAKMLISDNQIKKILITGGGSSSWESFFENEKKTMVVETHPHLIHSALHFWMTTQIEIL